MITAARLLAAIQQAVVEVHPSEQPYVDVVTPFTEVILDGRFDLEKIAWLLNAV